MDTVGPMSRTVEDAAITLGAIAGYDAKDPYTWDTPVPDYRHALDGNVRDVRVGIITEQVNSDLVDEDVRESVVRAVSVLGELGASVEEVSIPITRYANASSATLLSVEPASNHRVWIRNRIKDYGHDNQIGLLTGSIIPAQYYYKAQRLRSMVRQQIGEVLERYDLLVLPTVGKPACELQGDLVITSRQAVARLPYLLTRILNQASAPAISVPCGFTPDGLPIGLQIGGRPGEDATVLKVAHAYEQATPWHTMRPPAA